MSTTPIETRRRPAAALALGIAGFVVNLAPYTVALDLQVVFGSIAGFAALRLCGPVWGTLAATLAAGGTWPLWDHPYAFVACGLEAVWLSLCTSRWRAHALMADIVFWLTMGIPAVALTSRIWLGLDWDVVTLLSTKLALNQLLALVAAKMILVFFPMHRLLRLDPQPLRIGDVLMYLLVFALTVPGSLILTYQAKVNFRSLEAGGAQSVRQRLDHVQGYTAAWNEKLTAVAEAVVALAERAAPDDEETLRPIPARWLEALLRSAPRCIIQITLLDRHAQVVTRWHADATEPLDGKAGAGHPIRIQAAREGPRFDAETGIIHLIRPIRIQNEVAGAVLIEARAAIVAEELLLAPGDSAATTSITAPDGRLLARRGPHAKSTPALDDVRALPTGATRLAVDDGPGRKLLQRWTESYLIGAGSLEPTLPWRITVELPLKQRIAAYRAALLRVLAAMLTGTVLIAGCGWIFGRIATARMSRLAAIAAAIPERMAEPMPLVMPPVRIAELAELGDSLSRMAAVLHREHASANAYKRRLEQLLNVVPVGIYAVRLGPRTGTPLTYCSPRILEMFGYTRDEIMNRKWWIDNVHPEDRASALRAWRSITESGWTVREYRFRHKDGKYRWIHEEALMLTDEPQGMEAIGFCLDITEQKTAQAALLQASKLATLGELATGMSHELNQPLNIARMAAANALAALDSGELDAEYLKAKLQRIDGQIQRAARIIDQTRVFARSHAEGATLFDPADCAATIVDLVAEQLGKSGIALKAVITADRRLVRGHALLLEQVLLNLVMNARDAIEAGRVRRGRASPAARIEIRLENTAEDRIRIIVRDTGGGIRDDVLPQIFEPFFTTKAPGKGTGLGLPISHRIVTEMGGFISVSNYEHGAEFTVDLPLHEAGPAGVVRSRFPPVPDPFPANRGDADPRH